MKIIKPKAPYHFEFTLFQFAQFAAVCRGIGEESGGGA